MLIILAVYYQLKNKPGENNDIRDFVVLDKQPEYPGGSKMFQAFFNENFKWPKLALEEGAEGQVVIQFVVEKDGSLSDIKVVKDLGMGTKEEAIRVLRMMPHWKPGIRMEKMYG